MCMYAIAHSASIVMEVEDGYYNEKGGQAKNYTLFEINKVFAGMTASATLYVEIFHTPNFRVLLLLLLFFFF